MAQSRPRNNNLWIKILAVFAVLLISALLLVVAKNQPKSKISESDSRQLAQKYFGYQDPDNELTKTYDLDGGWCYSMLPTNGEESTGGVMLCIDNTGQGYEVLSFMAYPKDGESIYDYTSSLEREYSIKPRFKAQKSWDIKVDI